MINLLKPASKKELRAARSNVSLLRTTFLVGATVVFMVVIFVAGFFITNLEQQNYLSEIEQNKKKTTNFASVRKDAEAFERNLKIADGILKGEITYSDLIIQIAKDLPPDAVLTALSLSPESFGKPLTLTARTVSYQGALRLKTTLEASDLFKEVNIGSITASDGQDGSPTDYPFSVSINAVLEQSALQKAAS